MKNVSFTLCIYSINRLNDKTFSTFSENDIIIYRRFNIKSKYWHKINWFSLKMVNLWWAKLWSSNADINNYICKILNDLQLSFLYLYFAVYFDLSIY